MKARCDRADDVEDLVLGLVAGAEAARIERHISSCAICREEDALLWEERMLFARRADALPKWPEPPLPREMPLPRRWGRPRVIDMAAALAACFIAVMGIARFERRASSLMPSGIAPSDTMEAGDDEPRMCALGAPMSIAEETMFCATSPRMVCEEQVTSGLAGP